MNSKPEFTLNDIRNSSKVKVFQASELLTNEQKAKCGQKRQARPRKRRLFDDVDAYVAEMIARFGYETYRAWKDDEIDDAKMNRWILAERARERAQFIPIEGVIAHMVGACIKRTKKERAPKGPKEAQKIIAQEIKAAKGEG